MNGLTARVVDLWRHPIKAHGRERIDSARVTASEGMAFDRIWAVTHDLSKFDETAPAWVPCPNFQRAARTPAVMAIESRLDEATGEIHLSHPALSPFTLQPSSPESRTAFIAWLAPISPSERFVPKSLVRADRALTDSSKPNLALNFTASLDALSQKLGQELTQERWRGNIWLEGLAPFEEIRLLGHKIRIGDTILQVTKPIERCLATAANPTTGLRDADTLGALRALTDTQDFGIHAEVLQNGTITLGDRLEVL